MDRKGKTTKMDVKNENTNADKITNADVNIDSNDGNITSNNVKTGREKSNEVGTNNLIPLSERTKEEQKRIATLGGKKSGEVRKARKTASELLQKILTQNMTDEQIEEILGNASELLCGDKTAYNVMMVKALQVAMSGDTKGLQFVRDTVGDAPTTKTEVKAEITDSDKALIDSVKARLLG